MNKNIIIGVIVVAVVVLGAWGLYMNNLAPAVENNTPVDSSQTGTGDTQGEENNVDIEVEVATSKTYEILYTDAGYSPSTLTIKAGDMVVFKNQSSSGMWTASAMHPSHMAYGGSAAQAHCPDAENNDFDQCASSAPGTSWSFTFTKTGTWGYHDHMNSMHFGKVVVE